MKTMKKLLEQHREEGRFKPVVPHDVKSRGVGPRPTVDSAKAKLKEENDTTEKVEMVQSQLHFIHYACKEILDYIDMGGEVEEWYQVKVAKSFSEFESLHAFIEGEKRRTGMVKEEVEALEEGKMKEIAMDIGHHLDKHINNYKKVGGAEHLGQKTVDTAHKIAKMHGIEHKHAQKFVNDYVDSRLNEGENKQVKDGDPCWKGYEMVGMKNKGGKKVPNCVPVKEEVKDIAFGGEKKAKGTIVDKSGAKHSPMSRVRDIARKAMERQGKAPIAPSKNIKKMEEASDVPFEGGKPAKGTVTDKSGAKHSPMSRVRDLASKATEKQSNKARIVKDAAKKSKDKFQADPTLSSEIMKQ